MSVFQANSLSNEAQESKTLLEQSERGRRHLEHEANDMRDQILELEAQLNSLTTVKRKLDSECNSLTVSSI